MQAKSILEGLKINREVYLDPSFPIYLVKEQVVNFNALGRLFSMVQHPTIAAPFLDNKITVDCNATVGFDQCNFKNIASNTIQWKQQNIDLHYKKLTPTSTIEQILFKVILLTKNQLMDGSPLITLQVIF